MTIDFCQPAALVAASTGVHCVLATVLQAWVHFDKYIYLITNVDYNDTLILIIMLIVLKYLQTVQDIVA